MGVFVIAAYRPKTGMESQLHAALKEHLPILRSQNLVTDRAAYLMRSKNGTILEVFEWKSPQAIEQAHSNSAVLALWERFHQCCDYGGLKDLPETAETFPNFEPFEV